MHWRITYAYVGHVIRTSVVGHPIYYSRHLVLFQITSDLLVSIKRRRNVSVSNVLNINIVHFTLKKKFENKCF